MNKLLFAACTGGLSLFLAQAACAQTAAQKPTTSASKPVTAEVDAAFAAWDADKNGALSLQEFRNGWLELRRAGEWEARLRTQFHNVDANRNNSIDAGEYASLLLVKRAGKSAPPLSAFDANKDQRLEFGEYLKLVQQLAGKPNTPVPTPGK